MSGGGFDDGHIASRAWTKKKEVPVVENTPASTSQRLGVSAHLKPKKGGKIILNDELSMTRQAHRGQEQPKTSVATLLGKGGDDAEGDLSESYDKLSSSRFSLNKQGDVRFPGHGKYSATAELEDGLEQNLSAQSVPLSASGSSKPHSSTAKHNISSAKTGLRSTTAHETSVLTGTSTEGKGGVGNKRNFSGHLTPNESKSQLRQGDKDSHNSLEQSQGSKPSNGSQLAGLSLLRQNEQVLDYMYQGDDLDHGLTDSNLMADMEGTRYLAQLNHELDDMLAASNEELAADLTKEELNAQIERLEVLKMKLKEREVAKQRLEEVAAEFKARSSQLVEMPADYQEVVERISQEVLEQHQLRRSRVTDNLTVKPIEEEGEQEEDSLTEDADLQGEQNNLNNDSEILQFVQAKLSSPLYGFTRPSSAVQEDGQMTDPRQVQYLEGIARIRALDKILREKEMEERAIKKKIRQEREEAKQKRIQEIKARQEEERLAVNASKVDRSDDLSESGLSEDGKIIKNKSGVSHTSGMSSKSDFFMTQNKKVQTKVVTGGPKATVTVAHIKDSSGSAPLNKSAWKKVNPLRPSSQQITESAHQEQKTKSALDETTRLAHVEKNIREAFNPDRGSYSSTLTGEKLERYRHLMSEVESTIDNPELIKKQVDEMFLAVYGYPEELKAKFKDIDEKVREMTTPEELAAQNSMPVDIIRQRAEARILAKKIKQIDTQLASLDAEESEIDLLDREALQQKLQMISDPQDQKALLAVERTMSVEELEDPKMNTPEIRDVLERLRAEDLSAPDMEDMDAQEYLENLDFDKLEECFEGYISSLDQLSEKIKTQESAIMSLDGAKLEQEKQEIEKHMQDLQGAIARLEDFEKDPQYKIKTEEDAEEFEKRLTSELLGTAEILEFNYEEFSRRQLDIDNIRLENAFLRQQLEKVPIRNLETFDNDIQKELEVKYPYMFKQTDEPERPREEWEDEVDEILAKYASPAPQSPEQTVMESPT